MRLRNKFLIVGSILVAFIYMLTDPDQGLIKQLPLGSNLLVILLTLAKSVWLIGVWHLARKTILDYLDLEILIKKAMETSEGSGRAAMAVGLLMLSISILIAAAMMSN